MRKWSNPNYKQKNANFKGRMRTASRVTNANIQTFICKYGSVKAVSWKEREASEAAIRVTTSERQPAEN